MASKTEIANLAISHLATGNRIGALETEQSQEARVVRLFWDTALDQLLRDVDWPFATEIAALALVEEEPNSEWGFSYRYPSTAVKFRRILSGIRNDTQESKIPYRIAQDSAGGLVFCGLDKAEAETTIRVTDPAKWPPDFTMAFSFLLATYIAPRLTAGDPFKLGERAARYYDFHIARARAMAGNEEQPDLPPESEFIRGRE